MNDNIFTSFKSISTNNGVPGLDYGFMTCDSGNMFGGKTINLINRIKFLEQEDALRKDFYQKNGLPFVPLKIGAFVHKIDTRYSDGTYIVSHNGVKIPAIPVGSVTELKNIVDTKGFNVVAIDEVQFFLEKNDNNEWSIVHLLNDFLNQNKFVLVAGLEKDFRGLPFGSMGDLLALSDEKKAHYGTCNICGETAFVPQRLVNDKPAYSDEPTVLVGAKDSYEPRCRKHHILKERASVAVNKNE